VGQLCAAAGITPMNSAVKTAPILSGPRILVPPFKRPWDSPRRHCNPLDAFHSARSLLLGLHLPEVFSAEQQYAPTVEDLRRLVL
jgi:hypothetical protein